MGMVGRMVVCCDNGVSNRYCYMVGCGVDAIRPAGLGLVGYCLDMRSIATELRAFIV